MKKHGIKTLSEDEFLNLINIRKGLGKSKVDLKTRKKLEKAHILVSYLWQTLIQLLENSTLGG